MTLPKDEINSINSCVFLRCAGTKSSKLFNDLARNLDKLTCGWSVDRGMNGAYFQFTLFVILR